MVLPCALDGRCLFATAYFVALRHVRHVIPDQRGKARGRGRGDRRQRTDDRMKSRSRPRVWTTKTYDRMARFYDAFMRYLFPLGERGRMRVVEKLVAGSVLDVACGTGTLLEMAYRKGLECYGIDLSEGMIGQATKKVPGATISQASYYDIPYPDGYFDNVVATNALSGNHIDARKVISEMLRVCKSGGHLYIAEWPRAGRVTIGDRLVEWFADLNDDAPKDYCAIFAGLGYTPEVEILSRRYHMYDLRK